MNYKKYLLLGIPILFLIGTIFHYIYKWSGNNFFVGLISPVNESVWEHLKLVLFPMTLYWAIYCLLEPDLNQGKWIFSLFISLIASMLTIVCFYYTYTGALGIESLILDIFSLFLGICVGQLLGSHFYTYGFNIPVSVSITLLISLFFVFIFFTVSPPKLPIFKSSI